MSEKLCLKWNDFQGNMNTTFESLRVEKEFSDVAQQGSNVYEEAKKAVDQLVMKEGNSWVCKTCGKSAKYNTQIRKHAEIHIEGLSFPCQICGDTFRSRTLLKHHKSGKH